MRYKARSRRKIGSFTVKIQSWELWLAIIIFLVFLAITFFVILFGTDGSLNVAGWIVWAAFLAVMLFGIASELYYKITVDGSKDHFVYRTAFFRTHIIKYSDCEYFKPSFRVGRVSESRMYMLKTKNKRFFIDETAVNAKRFFYALKANGIPLKDRYYSGEDEEKDTFSVTLGKGKTVLGIFLFLLFGFGVFCMISNIVFFISDLFQGTESDVETFIFSVFLSLAFVFLIIRAFMYVITPFNFKITVYKDSESFDYRTAFKRTYNVMYKDCLSCKRSYFTDYYILKTKLKTFYIDVEAANAERFIGVLSRNKIEVR